MNDKTLLFQFDPRDPKFLTEGVWEADSILPDVEAMFVVIRVSTKKESQNTSIEHQLEHARNYSMRTNRQVTRIYVIRNSGLSMKRNKTFQKMLAEIRRGQCNLLYLHSLSRLSRKSSHLEEFVNEFVRHHVRVYAMLERFDTTHEDWRKDLLNWGFIYHHESLSASDRQRGCVRALELRGQYLGVEAPYGYEKDTNKGLRPATDGSAEVVKEIFTMLLAGTSPCRIARILTERGVPSPGVKLGRNTLGKWIDNTIRKILRNPVYRGDIRGRCTEVIEPGELARYVIPEDERIVHKDVVEGIVDSDVFDAAQKILEERAKGKKGAIADFTEQGTDFLADRLFCADCGQPMTVISRNWGQVFYVCSTHVRKHATCTGRHTVVKSALEQAVKSDVQSIVLQNAVLERIHGDLVAREEKRQNVTLKEVKILGRQIERLQQRQVQIMADFYDRGLAGTFDFEQDNMKSTFEALLASTNAEIQEKQRRKQLLEQSMFASKENVQQDYQKIVAERIQELVRLLVRRIEIGADGNVLRIVYDCLPLHQQNIKVA